MANGKEDPTRGPHVTRRIQVCPALAETGGSTYTRLTESSYGIKLWTMVV
jgi:hypothetical protein